jgi:hypothetical protein
MRDFAGKVWHFECVQTLTVNGVLMRYLPHLVMLLATPVAMLAVQSGVQSVMPLLIGAGFVALVAQTFVWRRQQRA